MILKKIVVAEDDDGIAHLVNMALGDAGYLCLRAKDGMEALQLARIHQPDLMVLDIMMPRLDGREVARRLKTDVILSRMPILMLTALGSVDDKLLGFDSGADDYLAKPFDLRELAARVSALIRSARRERDRNPTTNLPGTAAIDDYLEHLVKQEQTGENRDSSVVHVDLSGFDKFADQVGFSKAEQLVARLGAAFLQEGRGHGVAFLGHVGGSDFVAVAPTTSAVPWVKQIQNEFAQIAEQSGVTEMKLVAAITPVNGANSAQDIANRLSKTMTQVKKQSLDMATWAG